MSAISTNSHNKTFHNERLKESMEKEGCLLMTPYECYSITMFHNIYSQCFR